MALVLAIAFKPWVAVLPECEMMALSIDTAGGRIGSGGKRPGDSGACCRHRCAAERHQGLARQDAVHWQVCAQEGVRPQAHWSILVPCYPTAGLLLWVLVQRIFV